MMNIGHLIMNLSIFNLMVALEEQERLTQVNTVHPQWNINVWTIYDIHPSRSCKDILLRTMCQPHCGTREKVSGLLRNIVWEPWMSAPKLMPIHLVQIFCWISEHFDAGHYLGHQSHWDSFSGNHECLFKISWKYIVTSVFINVSLDQHDALTSVVIPIAMKLGGYKKNACTKF